MEEKITFETEDGQKEEFYVVEETKLNGVNYLLVADSEEEDAECLILKDMSAEDEQEALYVMVEDDVELDAVMKVFSELLEDVVIEG